MNKHFLSHLLHGLTYIIPLLLVSGFMIIIRPLFSTDFQISYLTPMIEFLWMLLFPLFSAFVMFSIADRPGIVPGLLIGFLIYHLSLGYVSVIIFSFITGYMILGIKNRLQTSILSLKSLISTLFIPIFSTSISLGLIYVWSLLISNIVDPNFNLNMPYGIIIALSIILASLMSYDFGGPINKIAFLIGVISLKYNEPSILMAAVMVGGMIPPLGIALSKLITPKLFKKEEYKKANLNILNGFTFMTEGAIPFVSDNLKRKRIIFMLASGLAGLVVSLFKTKTIFPHGGILAVPFMDQWSGFLVALGIGTLISALSYSVYINKTMQKM